MLDNHARLHAAESLGTDRGGAEVWRLRVVLEEVAAAAAGDDETGATDGNVASPEGSCNAFDESYLDDFAYRRQQARRPDHPEQAYLLG